MLDSNCVLPESFVVGRPDFVCSGLRCRKHKWDDNDDNFKLFAKPLLSPSPVCDINRQYSAFMAWMFVKERGNNQNNVMSH